MVGKPGRLGAFDQFLEALEVLTIERLGRTEVHGDTTLDDPVLFEDLIEHFQRTSAFDHVVL
jgi:hypothetical protein